MTLFDRYTGIRQQTENICKPLETEDYVVQPAGFVSPPKWHLAHTTWFFEHFILKEYLTDYELFDHDFDYLFNSYYNNVGSRVLRADRGNITRPGVVEIYKYRAHVDVNMHLLLLKEIDTKLEKLIEIGLNHEQQHQELLYYDIKYILGNNPLFPAYHAENHWHEQKNDHTGFTKINEGIYEIGFTGEGFSFDNEHGQHKQYIAEYEISNALVTNAEYLEFINSGGYADFNLWLDDGWAWVNQNKIIAPMYWHKINGRWQHYTLQGLREVVPNGILSHISYYEANAFANWKAMRLPTEAEWEVASDALDWGKRWEWTNSAYLAYPNYKKAPGAIGEYNGKFMINQMVLRGASSATAQNHSRKTYRNFFQPHERWELNGIRLVK